MIAPHTCLELRLKGFSLEVYITSQATTTLLVCYINRRCTCASAASTVTWVSQNDVVQQCKRSHYVGSTNGRAEGLAGFSVLVSRRNLL